MDFKTHALYGLEWSRGFIEKLIAVLDGDDWFHRVHDRANHPLWIVGHLGLADNALASKFAPGTANKPEGWDDLFWMGSRIQDRSAYPPVDEVLAYFRERRETLLEVIKGLDDSVFEQPAPGPDEPSPIAGAPNLGEMFLFFSRHESLHGGQLSLVHRALGHAPLVGG